MPRSKIPFISFAVKGKKPRRIELIWARQLKRGQVKTTHDFDHYVVRGKSDKTNYWYEENINLKTIYETFWQDKESARVDIIAFFCDSDDTDLETVSYFSGVRFQKEDT